MKTTNINCILTSSGQSFFECYYLKPLCNFSYITVWINIIHLNNVLSYVYKTCLNFSNVNRFVIGIRILIVLIYLEWITSSFLLSCSFSHVLSLFCFPALLSLFPSLFLFLNIHSTCSFVSLVCHTSHSTNFYTCLFLFSKFLLLWVAS